MPALPRIKPARVGPINQSGLVSLMLRDGAVGIWPLNEVNGTAAADIKGLNNGTYNGGFTLGTQGPLSRVANSGGATTFNGTSGYVDLGSSTAIQPTNTGTVEAWINWNGTRGAVLVKAIIGDNDISLADRNGFCLFFYIGGTNNDSLNFELASASASNVTSLTGTKLTLNTWYHVAATWDGSNIRTYLNGVQDKTLSQTVNATAGTYNTYISREGRTNNQWFPGIISHAAIYTTALSANQLLSHYRAGISGG